MKQIYFLLILLLLLGCERNRDIIVGDPSTPDSRLWVGSFSATYAGADDGEITVKDSIRFIFTDSRFFYYWHGENQTDTSVAGHGIYMLDEGITFINEMLPETNPPLTIDGAFDLSFKGTDTMILSQGWPGGGNSFFETKYFIELVNSARIPE